MVDPALLNGDELHASRRLPDGGVGVGSHLQVPVVRSSHAGQAKRQTVRPRLSSTTSPRPGSPWTPSSKTTYVSRAQNAYSLSRMAANGSTPESAVPSEMQRRRPNARANLEQI